MKELGHSDNDGHDYKERLSCWSIWESFFDYLVSRTYINSYFESKYTGLEEIVDFHLVESESTFFPYCSDLVIMIPAGFFLKGDNIK